MATTAADTTPAVPQYESDLARWWADDHNKAMYLVLPLIVIVYGGCAAIYCCAKARRYFRRQHRKRMRQQMGHHNDGYNDEPVHPPPPQGFRHPPPPGFPVQKPYFNPGQQNWKAEDCLAMEVSEIDNQLKQAFAMIDDVTKDIKNKRTFDSRSKPDILREDGENETELKRTRKYKYKHFSSAA